MEKTQYSSSYYSRWAKQIRNFKHKYTGWTRFGFFRSKNEILLDPTPLVNFVDLKRDDYSCLSAPAQQRLEAALQKMIKRAGRQALKDFKRSPPIPIFKDEIDRRAAHVATILRLEKTDSAQHPLAADFALAKAELCARSLTALLAKMKYEPAPYTPLQITLLGRKALELFDGQYANIASSNKDLFKEEKDLFIALLRTEVMPVAALGALEKHLEILERGAQDKADPTDFLKTASALLLGKGKDEVFTPKEESDNLKALFRRAAESPDSGSIPQETKVKFDQVQNWLVPNAPK